MKNPCLILASASPRRKELLSLMGLELELCPVDVDERLSGAPDAVVMQLAQHKARAAAAMCPGQPVLGADTLVACEGETLGKPKDGQDALRMLRLLSGRCNTVYTGVCVIAPDGTEDVRCEASLVRFVRIDDDSALRYIRSGEPMDKAGAYGVQGMGGMFVKSVEGSPSNVIGLPMHLVRDMLIRIGFEL
ncbi:MAG: septum formation protein Maf [Clostridia bacterium]|nr:septum formation protein Maf [Clostridia bacterium]